MTIRIASALALLAGSFAHAEPVDLFNGKDLSGWYGNNPHQLARAAYRDAALAAQQADFAKHWTVENGELVNDGEGPYATTDKEYGDVEFWVDYKTVAAADSGIYMRGAPQIQIWDSTRRDEKALKNGNDKGSGGLWNNSAGAAGKDPLVLADRPFGEWNAFHVKMTGARTWVWFNDKLVVDGATWENFWDRTAPLPAKGPIHLQTHGGEIRWRNIKLRELSSEEATALLREGEEDEGFAPIFNGTDLDGWAGPVDNYEVVDGAIRCKEGAGGTIYFDEELGEYVVRVEFKLPPGGNNGLAIHYPGQGGAAYDGLCELQVIDNTAEKYANLDERQYHGSAYAMVPAHRGYLRPVGEWNFQEVTVKGTHVTVELNGSVILDADLSQVKKFMGDKPHPGLNRTSGYFGFAGHRDPVEFRNVSIKRLKAPAPAKPKGKKGKAKAGKADQAKKSK